MGWGRPLGGGQGREGWGGGERQGREGGGGGEGHMAICREPLLSDLIPVTKPFSVCMHADS